MLEHLHQYSLADLQEIASGRLVRQLRAAVLFGTTHVLRQCDVCAPRGFICELCDNDADVLYPFQLGISYTCSACYSVYHRACSQRMAQCPRCERRSARQRAQAGDPEGNERVTAETGGCSSSVE